jgi:hypothetical protein
MKPALLAALALTGFGLAFYAVWIAGLERSLDRGCSDYGRTP